MGACPVRVISFDNYSVDTVGAQIKAIDVARIGFSCRVSSKYSSNSACSFCDSRHMSSNWWHSVTSCCT